jgi:predicted nucleic acid-binding protein
VTVFVLDCSVTMAWCFKDETDRYAAPVLDRLDRDTALVTSIWPLEVGSALVVAERRRRLTEGDAARFFDLLAGLPIVVSELSLAQVAGHVVALARRYGISVYDAAYLDLAIREGAPLATRDSGLRRAAADAGVPLFDPGGQET